jgi:hypothetical protein
LQISTSPSIAKPNLLEIKPWLFLALLLAGCAGRTTSVTAWANPKYSVTAPQRLALSPHTKPSPAETTLRMHLIAELERRGFELVAPTNADYTLTFWLEDSWKPGKRVEYYYHGQWTTIYPMTTRQPIAIGPWGDVYESEPAFIRKRVVDFPFPIQGIRLKLFPGATRHPEAHPLDLVWEGFIEGGTKVSAQREPQLLRTLLDHFGKDFNGVIRLPQPAAIED